MAVRLLIMLRALTFELVGDRRFHIDKVKKLYTFIATHGKRKNKSTKRAVARDKDTLLERLEAVIAVAEEVVERGKESHCNLQAKALLAKLEDYLPAMKQVLSQSARAFNGETVPACERVFSIFEPHTELLMRGKDHKPFEFGHLVQIGQTGQKFISYYEVAEKSRHDVDVVDDGLNDHRDSFDCYPDVFSADKNYYKSMENINEWEELIETFSVGKKGKRTPEEEAREHAPLFKLAQKFRAGSEGTISVLKRVFGLRRCLNRGFSSFASSIGCLVFCHNLVLLSKL